VIAVNLRVWVFMDAKQIGKMIRFHRKKSGLSQEGLASLGGLGKTVIFDIEKGKLSVRLNTLLKVIEVLNIKMEFQSPLMDLFEEDLNEKG
jgi:HTH-type transcriptional regulator/antitoxin HipB